MRLVLSLSLIALLSTGCTIHGLQHEGLTQPTQKRSGEIVVADRATGFSGGKVGWGRMTPFAIPVAPVYISGDESSDLMNQVSEALTVAGYNVSKTESYSDDQSAPVILHCNVDQISYSNYTWLAPLVPTWGDMDVTVTLMKNDSEILWKQSFRGTGGTLNFTDGYNISSKETMSELLNQMIEAFTSESFYQALQETGANDTENELAQQ